jgi:hypothetical protein
MRLAAIVPWLFACSSHSSTPTTTDAPPDGAGPGSDGSVDAPASTSGLGTVSNVTAIACPPGAPGGSTCRHVTVAGCPGIEGESIDATVAFLAGHGALKGTIVHFSGGGGEAFEAVHQAAYQDAGFQQAFVAWASDWEQTMTSGIKTAGCRPATILKWAFDDPSLQNGSRTTGFCGEGSSGGSGQLGYALAHYGIGDYLDYVNEISGPPFARIDLGCNFGDPSTAMVCGVADTMELPPTRLNPWENTTSCGTASPPAGDVAKWMADSIAVGGTYLYPNTRVEFWDCTNGATAVTAMAQIYEGQLATAGTATAYHCYAQADGCSGENIGTMGTQDSGAAMIAGCTPRH